MHWTPLDFEPAASFGLSCSGSTSLNPVEDGGIYLIRSCGLNTPPSPIPGVGLSGLVPRTESAVLGGLPFTSADFCDFRTHGPRMRIDELSIPSRRFVARVSASVATVDRCRDRGRALPAADNDFASVFAVPTEVGTGSAEAPAAATTVVQLTPSGSSIQGTDSAETTDPTASAPASPDSGAPDGEAIFGPHLHPDSPAYSNSSWYCTPCCRLWLLARRGPSTIFQADHHPAVSPTAAAGSATAATPAPAASSVPTVPIPSDRDRAESVGTPLLRLAAPNGDTPPAPAKLDALGDTAEL